MSEEMLRSYEELRAEFSAACAELEKEWTRRKKAERELKKWQEPFDAETFEGIKKQASHGDSLAAQGVYITALEKERKHLLAERDMLREALDTLQRSEAAYRMAHDVHGDGALAAGRAWDILRRAGDKARGVLFPLGGVAANQARAALKHSSSVNGSFLDADDSIPCPEAKRCQLAIHPRPGEFCSGTTHSDGLCFVTNQKPDARGRTWEQFPEVGR